MLSTKDNETLTIKPSKLDTLSKKLIEESIDRAVECAYGMAIMDMADLEETISYLLNCVDEAKEKYSQMTKSEFIAKVVDDLEHLQKCSE